MNQTDLREKVAAALATIPQVADGTWGLHDGPVDAISPPAFVLVWGPDPMRTVQTMCHDAAQLTAVAVGARIDIQGTYPVLEQMVGLANTALAGAGLRPYQSLVPAEFPIANLTYLASRLLIRQPVEVTSP